MISSGEKKALAIIAAVVVVFVGVVGGSVFALTRNVEPHQPYLHMAVGDELHTIEPARWCDLRLTECEPALGTEQRPTPTVPVPVGDTVMLSVSGEIAEGPWNLAAVYWTPKGLVEDEQPQLPGETYTVTLKTAPEYVLLGLTVYPASGVLAEGDEIVPRGVLTVQTAPEGFDSVRGPAPA